ncbi:LysR family transcriptional regulator [Alkalimonas collagenimarina]|uniref:LysR family transcriptional regulator n=1 Tax=Alkalimonas collagenimarina TaxID=400390 RepID=A0ABT9GZ21_9GAMM|nr:LysR family transcriptional regulator [Alkalimonas collagenimarina]MDP4536302.1 LysR family transcriptional regulator [Alkalimonas collagenimarina]
MARSTLEQWRMFQAVAEHGGFHQAAEAVFKSQSSIHHAVHKLEDVLGVTLFQVEGRKTQLTAAGEQLLRRINFLISEAGRMEQVAINLQSGVESKLSIAVDEAFPRSILYQTLEAVSHEYPLIRIELMESILSGANELLAQGKAEIAVSPFTLADNLSEDICQVEFVGVAGAGHPLHQLDRELTLEDLKECRQIVLRDSGLAREKEHGWLGSEQRWTVSHVGTSIELLLKNLGFAWIPRHAAQSFLASGQLIVLPLPRGSSRSMTFYLNFNDADTLGPVARAFLGHLRYLAQHA